MRELLAFAKAKSPWHAKRLSGVDADSFTEPEYRDRVGGYYADSYRDSPAFR